MSYYMTKSIKIKENGKIMLTVADSSVSPLTYYKSEYHGTLAELLKSINEGNFRLSRTKDNEPFIELSYQISGVGMRLDREGMTQSEEWAYGLDDRDKAIMTACKWYAAQHLGQDRRDSITFSEDLSNEIRSIIEEGKENLSAAKQQDIDEGKYRITCAARSIFQDGNGKEYDLLQPKGQKEFLLAPAEDYQNGVLQTDPKNIVYLGPESEDLYAYLSFTGVDMTLAEFLSKVSGRMQGQVDAVKDKFQRVDHCVERAIEAGFVVKPGIEPYKGWSKAPELVRKTVFLLNRLASSKTAAEIGRKQDIVKAVDDVFSFGGFVKDSSVPSGWRATGPDGRDMPLDASYPYLESAAKNVEMGMERVREVMERYTETKEQKYHKQPDRGIGVDR